jgi:hypothetical protein
MPSRPIRNIGKNVVLKPTKISQNESLPKPSFSFTPNSLGHQKNSAAKIANRLPPPIV